MFESAPGSPRFQISGDDPDMAVLFVGNYFGYNWELENTSANPDIAFLRNQQRDNVEEDSDPAAEIGTPTPEFLREMLAHARNTRPKPFKDIPEHITDVRIFRVCENMSNVGIELHGGAAINMPEILAAQWTAMCGALGGDSEIDMDQDGLPDRWMLELLAEVMFYSNMLYHETAWDAYVHNLLAIDAQFPERTPYRECLAALLLMSNAMRDGLVGALGLEGDYLVVSTAGKTTEEPFSGTGDFDGDGTTNLQEYLNTIGQGNSMYDFVHAAADPDSDGSESMPTAEPLGLAVSVVLLLGLGAGQMKRTFFRRPREIATY
jgi:hypothetical protein